MAAIADSDSETKELTGREDATLDSKGRILISKKKRDVLGDEFAMVIGDIGVLCIYPKSSWLKQSETMKKCDPMNPGRQYFQREFYGKSEAGLSCDAQGRVVIPSHLRSYAKLGENILIIGCYDHIEVWDPVEYQVYDNDTENYGLRRRENFAKAYRAMHE